MAKLDRSLIHSLPIFRALGDAELDAVMAHAKAQHIPKGAAIFRQGDIAHAFFVLLSGRLKAVKITPQGQQVLIRFINPGEIYGFTKALGREDYPATATAVVDSVTLLWPTVFWDDLVNVPAIGSKITEILGHRLQEAHSRVEELSTEEVAHRIAYTLLRLVAQSSRSTEEGILIDFPVTQQDIAQASGTTLHTVSRILNSWEKAGLVALGRRKIVVCDVPGLTHLAEDHWSASEVERDRSR